MVLRMYDVKNMFTALPRDQILKAVDELFEMTKGKKWGRNNDRRLVVVPKLKADRSRLMRIVTSRATVDPEIHFAFTFKQIREVLVWDMEHVYFMAGDIVLRQVNGLPIRSIVSFAGPDPN